MASHPTPLPDRSPELSAYDSNRFSHIIDWTPTSLLLHGRPISLVSAEIQYFRIPDPERWRRILIQIKGLGFNSIRLYIHWGYHSSAQGVYNFNGNRDINFLLDLCKQLHLFVIVAPGPYICAEVQAGGYPIWLVSDRRLRIRHMANPPLGVIKKWDQNFHQHCEDYMNKIIPMLTLYERTNDSNGCILALQIENELRQRPFLGMGGLDDEIRLLADIARKAGSTVPFFHNDDAPIGSWSAGNDYRSLRRAGTKTGQKAYRTDLYGFDLYFTFPPGDRSGDLSSFQIGMVEALGVSACLNCCGIGGVGIGGSDTQCLSCLYEHGTKHAPPPPLAWANTKQMERGVDHLAKSFNKFGGCASTAPKIGAEIQTGWINQWGRMRTYDDIYNFFGEHFSATLQAGLMAQGVNVNNHYIGYGGTNHGTIGDTEVYSSYDYSAFIREFGFVSGRGRILRQTMLFARSFSDLGFSNSIPAPGTAGLAQTLDKKKKYTTDAVALVKSTVPSALMAVRQAIQLNPLASNETDEEIDLLTGDASPITNKKRLYAFLRNLKQDNLRFNLIVDNLVIPCNLSKCESLIAPLYHPIPESDLSIFACTAPVICRSEHQESELWVLKIRDAEVGRLVLTVDQKKTTSRTRGVSATWATFAENTSSETISVTDQDIGAATSLLSAPLEELPLAEQNSLAPSGSSSPIGLRVSTEDVGLCFSISFSTLRETSVVVIKQIGENASINPILRLLCLTEKDAATFSANLAGNDAYIPDGPSSPTFAAAWGASELTFLPSRTLDVGFSAEDNGSKLFVIQDKPKGSGIPEQFQPGPAAASACLPGLSMYSIPNNALSTLAQQGVTEDNPLSPSFEIKVDKWMRRVLNWTDDVHWKSISYQNRDPLDHKMTSGHVAYRLRFRTSSNRGAIIINVRHSAVVWCNGKAVGGQVCFSHNVMSAGSMHAVDLPHAGKKRHNITNGLQNGPDENGVHEIIILVLSLGQSRSPFLLNDCRNKRGLLSARFTKSMRVSNVSWEITGVDVTQTDDAYGSSGLPLEYDMNSIGYDGSLEACPGIELRADAGLTYYRGSFSVPSGSIVGGNLAYPLRIKVTSGAYSRVMIWVNALFMGRYIEELGPQSNFYVPEGLIKQYKDNTIVLGVYGPVDTNLSVQILPWVVDTQSGNLDEQNGQVHAIRLVNFELDNSKKNQM